MSNATYTHSAFPSIEALRSKTHRTAVAAKLTRLGKMTNPDIDLIDSNMNMTESTKIPTELANQMHQEEEVMKRIKDIHRNQVSER